MPWSGNNNQIYKALVQLRHQGLVTNEVHHQEHELAWVKKFRSELCGYTKETDEMDYRVIEKNGNRYIECASKETPIRTEQNALDLIGACFEKETNLVLIHDQALAEEFFELRTGLAGSVLQKFGNYQIKVAVILQDQHKVKGKFSEFLAEARKGNSFKVFSSKEEAENWLINQ